MRFLLWFSMVLQFISSCNSYSPAEKSADVIDTIKIEKSKLKPLTNGVKNFYFPAPDNLNEIATGSINSEYNFEVRNVGITTRDIGDLDLFSLNIVNRRTGANMPFKKSVGFGSVESSPDEKSITFIVKKGYSDESDCFDVYSVHENSLNVKLIDSNICNPTYSSFLPNSSNSICYLKSDSLIIFDAKTNNKKTAAILSDELDDTFTLLKLKIMNYQDEIANAKIIFKISVDNSLYEYTFSFHVKLK